MYDLNIFTTPTPIVLFADVWNMKMFRWVTPSLLALSCGLLPGVTGKVTLVNVGDLIAAQGDQANNTQEVAL